MKHVLFATAVAAASLLPALAQEEGEISTDRPDYTESTDTIAPGLAQFEGGFLLSRHALAAGAKHDIGAPFALLRLGLTRFVELRLGADGFTNETHLINGEWEQHGGGSDLEVSAKVRLHDDRVYLPAFAFIAGASVPTGSSYFSSGRVNPFLELCWSKSLPKGFDSGGNVNFRWGGPQVEHGYSLSIGHKLGRGFAAYGEIYRISPVDGDERAHWIANAGITKGLGENAQLDLEAGHTVHAQSPFWFLGAGFAIRMHTHGMIAGLLAHLR